MAGPGSIAVGAVGAALLLVTLFDVFVTIFNYDGYTFLAGRLHHLSWRALRHSSAILPERARRGYLSLGSAAMLPMTLVWWLTLEVTAFALMYFPGMRSGAFRAEHLHVGLGTAFYLSGGVISSLSFGDVVPHGALFRALTDVETIIGIATFTLALTYVLTAFDTLGTLNALHGRVRRHAVEPRKPANIIARYYHGGQPGELSGLLAALSDDLDGYDQGLRRYPVVFYFHARRPERSIPTVFEALGNLVELLRWGLPADEPLRVEPHLLALAEQYTITVSRLQRSFVGPEELDPPDAVPQSDFPACYADSACDDGYLADFRELRRTASEAAGLAESDADRYEHYREWLPFHHRRCVFLRRVRVALGYA